MVLVGRKEIHFSGKYARQGNRNHFSNQSSRIASQNENNTIVPDQTHEGEIFEQPQCGSHTQSCNFIQSSKNPENALDFCKRAVISFWIRLSKSLNSTCASPALFASTRALKSKRSRFQVILKDKEIVILKIEAF